MLCTADVRDSPAESVAVAVVLVETKEAVHTYIQLAAIHNASINLGGVCIALAPLSIGDCRWLMSVLCTADVRDSPVKSVAVAVVLVETKDAVLVVVAAAILFAPANRLLFPRTLLI